jgi:hypothetical protein
MDGTPGFYQPEERLSGRKSQNRVMLAGIQVMQERQLFS